MLRPKMVISGKVYYDGPYAVLLTDTGVEKYNLEWYRVVTEGEKERDGHAERTVAQHR